MMKVSAILQMILGSFIAFCSWTLASSKAYIPDFLLSPAPSSVIEFMLLSLGLAVLICGFFLWKAHIKYAGLQIVSGLVISIIYVFLGIRAINAYYYSTLYYLAYLPFVLGIVVFATGIMQLIKR
jgi:hypothetical protein